MAHGRTYDALNRLTDARTLALAGGSFRAGYGYNAVGQRTNMTLADGARWRYQYDVHGQWILGKKSWSDGVPVAGGQFEYAFDDIGNRTQAKSGGNSSGTGLRQANYTPTLLNQYSSYTVPEVFDVMGSAPPGASVTVNGGATYRKGDFWQAQTGGNNATGAVAVAVNVQSVSNTVTLTSNGVVFLPRSSVTNAYDADGNLTTNGQFSFAWDAENRLASFTPLPGTPTNQWQAGRLAYDYAGRRISKAVSNYVASVWQLAFDHRYVYDGWNLVAVLDANGTLLLSFTWGNDLSGTAQGAGGVSGLISMTVHTGPLAGTYFYVFDGNGNVVALVNAVDGSVAAQYEYGPFGELLRCTGPLAALNPFRFSTKFQDDETGLLYYGYRYYDPGTGRWMGREPLGEAAGVNLHAFLGNGPVNTIDVLGASDFNRPPLVITGSPTSPQPTAAYGPPSANPVYGNSAYAYYTTVIDVTIAVGANATYEGVLRKSYEIAVSKLQQSFRTLVAQGYLTEEEAAIRFVEARNDLTRYTRQRSGALARTIAEALKPEKEFQTYEQLRKAKSPAQILERGGARPAANVAGRTARIAGGACVVAGIGFAIVDIAAADPAERGRKTAGHVGGTAGSLAFGYVGSEIGALGGPIGAGIGFVTGTVTGAILGSKAGENYYDAFVNE